MVSSIPLGMLFNIPELLGVRPEFRPLVWPEFPPFNDGLQEKIPCPEEAGEGLRRGKRSISREKEGKGTKYM